MFSDARLQRLWSILESGGADALTLDVFDTVLLRVVPEPMHAFVLLGERLHQLRLLTAGMTADTFARARIEAERRARQLSAAVRGTEETRLAEIWEVLAPALRPVPLEELVAHEVELESELCRVDLELLELLTRVRTELGTPVALVSDSYFSAGQLHTILRRAGLTDVSVGSIYTSGDHGVSKSEGLFKPVVYALGVAPGRVVHLGDHPVADLEAARELGMQSLLYAKLTPRLRDSLRREGLSPDKLHADLPLDRTNGDFGLTAVRARVLARREAEAVPTGLRPFWETGASVFGPPLAGFADWVTRTASSYGVDQVFCLMREGEFLGRLIADAASDSLAVRTLWASRHVCALASVYEATPQELEAFLARRRPPTAGQLAEQLGVSLRELPALAALSDVRLDAPGAAQDALHALTEDPAVRAAIALRGARMRERLLGYLDARLPERGVVVLVDLGWGATIQSLLSQIVRGAGRDVHFVGLYLATNEGVVPRALQGIEALGYLAQAGEPARLFRSVMRSPEVLEQLCMPDVGSLVGFDEQGEPLTAEMSLSRTQTAQKVAAQEGVLAFSREWQRYRRGPRPLPDLSAPSARRQLLRMIERFLAVPSKEEAFAFRNWAHDENFGSAAVEGLLGEEGLRLVPYLSVGDLERLPMQELYWPAAAAAAANPTLARLAAVARETDISAEEVSAPSLGGPVEAYLDLGADFINGPKETVVPRCSPQGLSVARLRLDGGGVRRIRIDPDGRRGLVRIDRLRLTFHLRDERQPQVVVVERLADDPHVRVEGARLLQSGLLEVTSDDPQLVYVLDDGQLAGWSAATYAVDVELLFAWLGLRSEPLAVPEPAVPQPLSYRVARKVVRELGRRL